MIIFQADDPRQNAVDAVHTALAIQHKVGAINDSSAGDVDPIAVNIGINSGVASVDRRASRGRPESAGPSRPSA